MKISTVLLALITGGLLFTAGCTGPVSPGTTPVITTAGTPAAEVVTTPLSPLPTPAETFWPEASRIGEYTTVPTTRPASDNPYLENLNIRKRTFQSPLPSCLMENAFPAIAKDAGYGIQQVVPKLAVVSEHEYLDFLREYTEGDAENTPLETPAGCQNTANEPTWNFIEVRVILVPTNFFPANYTVTENVLSDGKIVAQFASEERLVIDQKIVRTVYVPVHADEVDLFDSVDVTFTRQ